jgi:ferredoxin
MLQLFRSEKLASTKFVLFDANKCVACWVCLNECSSNVISKVDLFFHKHARITNNSKCIGCLRCIAVCNPGAFTKKINNEEKV